MTRVFVSEDSLEDIADAIRAKNGSEGAYKPSQMAAAIEAFEMADDVALANKSISANGTYQASSDSVDGYATVVVSVPNTYVAADEGKVVSSGALVAQTARATNITANGTYSTTENNSVTVAIPSCDSTTFSGSVQVEE